ncbi:MAG TPA: 2-dehydropantoate 2-reductase, partial [Acidimicrobiales bacterium]|nr:2-dehydropantoate 2-reductase [Acidimicrobiales bacterium]
DPSTVPASDVVVVATKTTATSSVVPLVAELAGPATTIVVMQNGLGVDAPFADAVPGAVVLGAMCFMCCNKVGPGHVVHLDEGAVTLGEFRPDGSAAGITDAVEAVMADLRAAGVPTSPVADLETGRWRKLVWNVPFNGLSVVLDAGTDEMLADPAVRSRAEQLMREVLAGAEACGHGFDPAFVDRMMATTEAMTPYKPSMKLDFEAGRPLELDAIYAAPIAAAARAGCAMPATEELHAELRALDPARAVTRDRGRDGTSRATGL